MKGFGRYMGDPNPHKPNFLEAMEVSLSCRKYDLNGRVLYGQDLDPRVYEATRGRDGFRHVRSAIWGALP